MSRTKSHVRTAASASRQIGHEAVLRLAERVAARESERIGERYDDNVLSISVAYKIQGHEELAGLNGIGIRFLVEKKYAPSTVDRRIELTTIPSVLTGRTKRGDAWITAKFPTDVVERPSIRLQAPSGAHIRVSDRLGVTLPDGDITGPREVGSICCYVKESTGDAIYMLSCNHVFGRMLFTRRWRGRTRAQIDLRNPAIASVARVSARRNVAKVHPQSPSRRLDRTRPSLDAALALVDPTHLPVLSSAINGVRATRVFRAVSQLKIGQRLFLVSPSTATTSGPKPVTISTIYRAGFPLRITKHGQDFVLFFPSLIEYRVRHPSGPQAGDSGAPVIDSKRRLVGMHIAGDTASGLGYALLARDIIRQSTFGRFIKLESNL